MRLDSPVVLATAGTLAIHVIIAILGDALVILNPPETRDRAPIVELVEIEPPPILQPPPPPVAEPETKQPETKPVEQPRTQKVVRRSEPPPETREPPPPTNEPQGGAPVATMEGVAPSATGVAVASGPRGTGRIGRGGTGTGTGAGHGSGTAETAAVPVSVATIKTRAMPRGDFSYFDASKDYPAEARSLGIEGVIRVRLVVDEKGKVKSTTLLNKLGHGLDELALKRAAAIDFDPAKDTNDQPVTSVVVWTFNMTLPK